MTHWRSHFSTSAAAGQQGSTQVHHPPLDVAAMLGPARTRADSSSGQHQNQQRHLSGVAATWSAAAAAVVQPGHPPAAGSSGPLLSEISFGADVVQGLLGHSEAGSNGSLLLPPLELSCALLQPGVLLAAGGRVSWVGGCHGWGDLR